MSEAKNVSSSMFYLTCEEWVWCTQYLFGSVKNLHITHHIPLFVLLVIRVSPRMPGQRGLTSTYLEMSRPLLDSQLVSPSCSQLHLLRSKVNFKGCIYIYDKPLNVKIIQEWKDDWVRCSCLA